MSNYYASGQLAQYDIDLDRQDVIDKFMDGIDHVNAIEERYQDWVYRYTCTVSQSPDGGESLLDATPLFIEDM